MCITLVIDGEKINERSSCGDFSRADFSHVWLNFLEKFLGKCPIVDISGKAGEKDPFVPSSPVLIFSSSVHLMPEWAVDFVKSGGIILAETPSSSWNDIIGAGLIKPGAGPVFYRAESGFSGVSERIMPPPYSGHLEETPLFTRLVEAGEIPDGAEILLYIEDHPAILQLKIGLGRVIFILFDLQMALTALRQGVPGPGYSLKKRTGRIPFIVESQDLVIHEKMLQNTRPYADILEKFVCNILEDSVFLPRLWYYPYRYDGVFLMSHDDEKRGFEKSAYMVEEESAIGGRSTFFIISGPGVENRWSNAGENVLKRGFDIQWHWNRFPDNIRIFSPDEQLEFFKRIQGSELTSCRVHFLNWGGHYTKPYRVMESAGVVLDGTYGPNKGKGYLYGTGKPYRPVDVDGKLFNLYEVPFQTQEDWGGVDDSFFDTLLRESFESYHSVIVPLFHPHKIAAGDGKGLWLGSFGKAKEYNHWISTFSSFGEFLSKRSEVKISFSGISMRAQENEDNGLDFPALFRKNFTLENIPSCLEYDLALVFPLSGEKFGEKYNKAGDNMQENLTAGLQRDYPGLSFRFTGEMGRKYIVMKIPASRVI